MDVVVTAATTNNNTQGIIIVFVIDGHRSHDPLYPRQVLQSAEAVENHHREVERSAAELSCIVR